MKQGHQPRRKIIRWRLAGILFLIVAVLELSGPLFSGDEWTTILILRIAIWAGVSALFLFRGFAQSEPRG